jgi:dihydrofolate synthase/folylpolyglutamate synthase
MNAPARRSPAAAYLASRTRFGIKFGLETMRALMDALGRPQLAFATLLVAGTNGKGSVAAYADAGLRAAGLRTGRNTSPHLVRVNERIAVGGDAITSEALESAVDEVRRAARRLVRAGTLSTHPTFFEAVTAAAFVHFRAQAVEAAVVEVGMGARLDATNVTEPLVSAIVTVDMDHEKYLGATLAAIGLEKAGVLRPRRVTVLGAVPTEARIAILREADRVGARCVDALDDTTTEPSTAGLRVSTARGEHVVGTLPGLHQRANAVVALRLLEEAEAAGLRFDLARAARGFADARWPGRLQRVAGRPSLLLDGAHNVAGAAALAAALRAEPPFVLVFGAMADKDVSAIGRLLFPLARAVVVTQAPGERAATPVEIVARVGPVGPPVRREPGIARALAASSRLAGPEGLVVVAGSLYLVGDVLRRLERRDR